MNTKLPVKFDCEIKPEWIDYTLDKFILTKDRVEFRKFLRDRFTEEINSKCMRDKLILQLDRTVGYNSIYTHEELFAFHGKMTKLSPEKRNALRKTILVNSNRFVFDCLKLIHKLNLVQSSGVRSQQVYDRISDIYGERKFIPRRVRYVLKTLANFGVLENKSRRWYIVIDNDYPN